MSKFLDIKRTADEWRELTINVQNTMDGIVYNGLIALCGGNFDDVNRYDLSNILHVKVCYIDYIIDCYSEFENNPYESYLDYYEEIYKEI